MPTPFLSIHALTKRFGSVTAVDGVSLDVPQGDLLALLGPSGSGKTTALRLLAGFETPDHGRILVDGAEVTGLAPAARRFGMVFQHYALFPHLDVGGNVGFGLESRRLPAAERARRIREALELVELGGLERRPVGALSGGQQQRVALARALAPEPRVLLLDEPLSNLDPGLRERTRRELRALIHRIGITTILVTHEQEEAFDLADHVALLQAGRLMQVGTPEELYGMPENRFVAGFIGRASVVPVTVASLEGSVARVRMAGTTTTWDVAYPAGSGSTAARGAGGLAKEGETTGLLLYVRPEAVRLVEPSDEVLSGAVVERRYLGGAALYTVRVAEPGSNGPGGPAFIEVLGEPAAARVGDRVGVVPRTAGAGLHLFPADEA